MERTVPDDVPLLFPLGHFYSPVCSLGEIEARREQIWPVAPRPTPDIDWRGEQQRTLAESVFAAQEPLTFATEEAGDPTVYWAGNDQFPPLDACVLAAILRQHRPARMIEIGSGFSSLVAAQVNRDALGGRLRLTCVEPFPRQFLTDGVDGISELRREVIQDTPLELFATLGEGDVLFVDSSHTVKTGSDVVWIFHEILPRLRPGVLVHLHDIFLPGDYPETWVRQGRGWNEMYLVRSFLSYNNSFEIVWGSQFMIQRHPESLRRAFPELVSLGYNGGSLWLRRSR